MKIKKYYTIQINYHMGGERWYANKNGREYENAYLANGGTDGPVFYVNPCQFIPHQYVIIISEKEVQNPYRS